MFGGVGNLDDLKVSLENIIHVRMVGGTFVDLSFLRGCRGIRTISLKDCRNLMTIEGMSDDVVRGIRYFEAENCGQLEDIGALTKCEKLRHVNIYGDVGI